MAYKFRPPHKGFFGGFIPWVEAGEKGYGRVAMHVVQSTAPSTPRFTQSQDAAHESRELDRMPVRPFRIWTFACFDLHPAHVKLAGWRHA
jgi:hypothetical protein